MITIALTNESVEPRRFNRISASCGCLSGLPERVLFDKHQLLEIRVRFQSPKSSGDFIKVIALTDTDSEVQLRIELKGRAQNAVAIGQKVFATGGVGKKTFETKLFFRAAGFDPESFDYRPSDPRILGWRVSEFDSSKSSAVVKFDVVTRKNDMSRRSIVDVVDIESGKVVGSLSIELRGEFKTLARPSALVMREKAGVSTGRVAVQLQGFCDSGVQGKKVELKVTATPKFGSEDTSEFKVAGTLFGTAEAVTLVSVQPTNRILLGERSSEYELRVTFVGENDSLTIPVVVVDGD
ncbi:MAG: DUF1573 domain-containing protein [Pirellulaceae bacterium]